MSPQAARSALLAMHRNQARFHDQPAFTTFARHRLSGLALPAEFVELPRPVQGSEGSLRLFTHIPTNTTVVEKRFSTDDTPLATVDRRIKQHVVASDMMRMVGLVDTPFAKQLDKRTLLMEQVGARHGILPEDLTTDTSGQARSILAAITKDILAAKDVTTHGVMNVVLRKGDAHGGNTLFYFDSDGRLHIAPVDNSLTWSPVGSDDGGSEFAEHFVEAAKALGPGNMRNTVGRVLKSARTAATVLPLTDAQRSSVERQISGFGRTELANVLLKGQPPIDTTSLAFDSR